MTRLIDLLGWSGAFMLLLAYRWQSRSRAPQQTIHLLNLIGAIGICACSYVNGAYPPAVLNLIWAIVALRELTRRRKGNTSSRVDLVHDA